MRQSVANASRSLIMCTTSAVLATARLMRRSGRGVLCTLESPDLGNNDVVGLPSGVFSGTGQTKLEAEVVHQPGLYCEHHGGSEMRVYASHGGLGAGKKMAALDVARGLPVDFFTINLMEMERRGGAISIKQFVAMVLVPILLSQGLPEHSIVGGWSLGCFFAFHAAFDLEACIAGPRAVFTMDSQELPPRVILVNSGADALGKSQLNHEILKRSGRTRRDLVNWRFVEVSKWLLLEQSSHFTSPVSTEDGLGADNRRTLFASSGEVNLLKNTRHATLGITHAWDISRHLRSL